MRFPITLDEPARLAELVEAQVLDTAPEPAFDDVVALAARLCDAPIALVNFVDADRQWSKALHGLDDGSAARETSFCARTIVADDGLLVVEDAHADPAWERNPMVTGGPRLRFYAGVAIVSHRGHALGTVCIADREPRTLSAEAERDLRRLARQTAALLELRITARRLRRANLRLAEMAAHDELTGLPNVRLTRELLDRLLPQHRRSGRPLGLVHAEVGGLRAVDRGPAAEHREALLRHVAGRLRGAARAADTVARVGDDSFVVVCPDLARRSDVARVATRLAATTTGRVTVEGAAVTPVLRTGTAVAEDADDPGSLLARAAATLHGVTA